MKKNVVVRLRLTDDEHKMLFDEYSLSPCLTLSDFIRRVTSEKMLGLSLHDRARYKYARANFSRSRPHRVSFRLTGPEYFCYRFLAAFYKVPVSEIFRMLLFAGLW